MEKITIICEKNEKTNLLENVSFELISKAKRLIQKADEILGFASEMIVEAICFGLNLDDKEKEKLYSSGADKIVLIKDETLEDFCQTTYSKSFLEYFNQNPSKFLLFSATQKGRTLAPRITTLLNTGLVADCTDLDFTIKNNELKLIATRPTFGAELMASIISKKNPQCATIRPMTFKAEFIYNKEKNNFEEFKPNSYQETRFRVIQSVLSNSSNDESENLKDAKIIFAAGMGLYQGKDTQYFEKLKRLAKLTNASFAVSRKIVDLGLEPHKIQIGQTGQTVTPELYIAFGISGAIQHIMGMKNSKTIVAVNTDENAEIFKYSDYKIVKDAKALIDELLTMV